MTLQQIKYVIEVATKGSINEAAKGLFISQPSFSNAIKELERKIVFTLFMLTNRGIEPIPDGEEIVAARYIKL